MSVAVIGAGAFGTALAVSLASKGKVALWGRDIGWARSRENPRLPGVRLPAGLQVTSQLEKIEAETLLLLLDEAGICASAGSACSAGAVEPSHVLLALGLTPAQAKSTLRLTLDAANTAEEIDTAAAVITACVQRLRDGVR